MEEKGVTGTNEIKTDSCYLGDFVTYFKKHRYKDFLNFRMQGEIIMLDKSSEESVLLAQG